MAAPTKPWESTPPCCRTPAAVNNRMVPPEEMRMATATVPQFQSTLGGGMEQGSVGGAPPIPPRPAAGLGSYGSPFSSAMSPYSGYGGFGGGYGTGYGSGYGTGYGSGYGTGYGSGYGMGYGGYGSAGGSFFGRPGGLGPGPESWFIEAAEESSRGTFESIESFVSVFTSISQMMESTYMLVHSSFRAVVGVAEQMGRMRLHLAEVMSAISVVRTLRWIINFLRRWLGYPELGGADAAWSESAGPELPASGPRPSRWPVLVYLLTVLGAPYLIFRLLRGAGGRPDNESWKTGAGEHFSAVCSFDFSAGGAGELTVRAGQSLRLAPRRLQPRVRGWVLAADETGVAGLLPSAYVKIRGAVPAGGVPGVAGVTSRPAPPPVPPPVASGGGPAMAAPLAAGQACPAPAADTKPTCCRSKTAAAAVHAATPASAPAPAASAPASAPAPTTGSASASAPAPTTGSAPASAPAPTATTAAAPCTEAASERVSAMKRQLPGNVKLVEVDPTTVSVASLKADASSAGSSSQ